MLGEKLFCATASSQSAKPLVDKTGELADKDCADFNCALLTIETPLVAPIPKMPIIKATRPTSRSEKPNLDCFFTDLIFVKANIVNTGLVWMSFLIKKHLSSCFIF